MCNLKNKIAIIFIYIVKYIYKVMFLTKIGYFLNILFYKYKNINNMINKKKIKI